MRVAVSSDQLRLSHEGGKEGGESSSPGLCLNQCAPGLPSVAMGSGLCREVDEAAPPMVHTMLYPMYVLKAGEGLGWAQYSAGINPSDPSLHFSLLHLVSIILFHFPYFPSFPPVSLHVPPCCPVFCPSSILHGQHANAAGGVQYPSKTIWFDLPNNVAQIISWSDMLAFSRIKLLKLPGRCIIKGPRISASLLQSSFTIAVWTGILKTILLIVRSRITLCTL